jgi:hypothetical protein
MKNLNPTGIVSKIEKDGKVFQIQTEYLRKPRPKIKSSIVSDGKVINTVEKKWDEGIQSEMDLEEVEKCIRLLHREVTDKLKAKKERRRLKEFSFSDFLNLWRRISEIREVKNVLVAKDDGALLFSDLEKGRSEQLSKIIACANELALNFSFFSDVGGFQGGVLDFLGDKMTWIFHENKAWALFFEEGIDLELVIRSIRKLIRGEND